MKNTLTLLAALFTSSAAIATAENTPTACPLVQEQAAKQITQSPEKVLEIVSKLIAANEACAGEVVKAAIIATSADKALVAQIVETAATAAPKQLSQIAAYALAIAPDAKENIVAVLDKINSNEGTAQTVKKVSPLEIAGGEIVPSGGPISETGGINAQATVPPIITE